MSNIFALSESVRKTFIIYDRAFLENTQQLSLAITRSKLAIETLKQGVKYVQN